MYFWSLFCANWINVLGFNTWATFNRFKILKPEFIHYFAYIFAVSGTITICVYIAQILLPQDSELNPSIGFPYCWFHISKKTNYLIISNKF